MRIREQFDADRFESVQQASSFQTAEQPFGAVCEMCRRTWYVSPETNEAINRAIDGGLDNPFLCDDCREEYEELASSAAGPSSS